MTHRRWTCGLCGFSTYWGPMTCEGGRFGGVHGMPHMKVLLYEEDSEHTELHRRNLETIAERNCL